MPAIGGSIESVSLSGKGFAVAADADTQRKLGGYENEVSANGDGTARLIKTRVVMSVTGLTISIDDDRGDHEFLQELADRNAFFPVAIVYASGAIWQGTAQITGELAFGSQNATASIDLSGTGNLTLQ